MGRGSVSNTGSGGCGAGPHREAALRQRPVASVAEPFTTESTQTFFSAVIRS